MATIRHTIRGVAESIRARADSAAGGPVRLQIILVLGAVLGLDTADKATVSAIAGSLKNAFGINNTEIGILIAAVSFVGAVFTLPIGSLADRIVRRRILLAAISLWTAAMVVSGTATSFVYLLVTRIFLGAVTAAAAPTIASLVGDFFPARTRAQVYGMILSGELVGVGFGFFVSGEISSLIDWRWSFYVMALPSIAIGWAIWRYLPEPARGGQSWIRSGQQEVPSSEGASDQTGAKQADAERPREAEDAQETVRRAGVEPRPELVLHEDPSRWSLWRAIGYALRIPTYGLLVIASALGYYFFAGVRAFGMIYITGHYGVSRSTASALTVVIGIGALAGVIVGGIFSEWMLKKGWFEARILVPGTALLIAAILFAPAVWVTNIAIGIILLTAGATALAAANPSIDAARLDIIPSGLWGRAEAGRMALRGVFEGGAPILFGLLSDWLGGGARGLMWTFLIMIVPLLAASSLAIPARKTYLRDVATAGASKEEIGKLDHRVPE